MLAWPHIPHTREHGTPIYRLDVPSNFYNERADKLFADDLIGMISWLEQHTPGRMDWDRMKEICEGRNRMLELETEAVGHDQDQTRPAGVRGSVAEPSVAFQSLCRPQPISVRHFESLVDMARKNLTEKIPATKNEKYRAVLWNPPFPHFSHIFNKSERAYGVTLSMTA